MKLSIPNTYFAITDQHFETAACLQGNNNQATSPSIYKAPYETLNLGQHSKQNN